MQKNFERVEKHLYRRQYQTSTGDWSTLYYVRFTDWKKIRRTFPLGADLKTARDELKVLEARNIRREDFDADKEKARQGITFSEWAKLYFKEKIDPEKRVGGVDRERRSFKKLEPFFGNLLLSEINRSKIMEYRAKRLQEPIIRRGKPVEGTKIAFPTLNRELAFLRYMLNLAADDGIIETVPKMKLQSEKGRKRDRIASEDEYKALLENVARPAQRVLIGLYETAMRVNEVLRLTWDRIDEKAGLIRLKAEDVKEKAPRRVPISEELQSVLDELKAEQRRVSNISNRVFTRRGRPITNIRTAFDLAKEKAKIEDLRLHDLRHTCITRWSMMAIPREAVMAASGHHSIEMHDRYVNVKDHHLKEAFKFATTLQRGKPIDHAASVSY
jgi:integrase